MTFAEVFFLSQKAATLNFLFSLMEVLSLKTGAGRGALCPIQRDPRGSSLLLLFVTFFTDNIIEIEITGAMDISIVAFFSRVVFFFFVSYSYVPNLSLSHYVILMFLLLTYLLYNNDFTLYAPCYALSYLDFRGVHISPKQLS